MDDFTSRTAEDWVIATGKTTTVERFVRMAFAEVGIELDFSGSVIDEKSIVVNVTNPSFKLKLGKEVLSIDPAYFRPTEVDLLIGDPTKAKKNWVDTRTSISRLVKDMMLRIINDDRKISI